MNRDLRIVFMGTPEFAVTTLSTLISNNYNVVAVITAPDRPSGRGLKLSESAVKKFAKEKGLPILQPEKLRNEEFLKVLKALNPNLQIVIAFRMLPKVVWQLPEYGTFNLHASLLPDYRGAAPINWAIINGDSKTGVTTFFIDEKIDTGEIIIQEEVIIDESDTAGSLHDKLMHVGSRMVIKTVDLIKTNQVTTIAQESNSELRSANKLNPENCKINWRDSVRNIHNHIRGLSPYPVSWCFLDNGSEEIKIKIYATSIEKIDHDHDIGLIISDKKSAKVAVKDGYVFLQEIQLPGKRKMDIKSLLNGYQFKSTSKMR